MHKYFSPYDSPYDAYIYYMNALADFEATIEDAQLRKDVEEFWKADKATRQNNTTTSNSKPITKSHPQAFHTSRLLDFTKNLMNS